MALTKIPTSRISYQCLSTDISGSKVDSATYIGADLYVTDWDRWYRVLDDLTITHLNGYNRDFLSNATITVDFPHHEIHEGDHFIYTSTSATLGADRAMAFQIVTPDSTDWSHFTFLASGTLRTNLYFYEDTGFTGGTPQIAHNNNRNYPDSGSNLIINKNPNGGSGSGTLLYSKIFGASTANPNSGNPSDIGEREEFILKQNTPYLFTVVSEDTGNRISVEFSWYNHISGELGK